MKLNDLLATFALLLLCGLPSSATSHEYESTGESATAVKVVPQPLAPLELRKHDHICLVGNALGGTNAAPELVGNWLAFIVSKT